MVYRPPQSVYQMFLLNSSADVVKKSHAILPGWPPRATAGPRQRTCSRTREHPRNKTRALGPRVRTQRTSSEWSRRVSRKRSDSLTFPSVFSHKAGPFKTNRNAPLGLRGEKKLMANQSLPQSLNMSRIQSYRERATSGRPSDTLYKTDLAGKKKKEKSPHTLQSRIQKYTKKERTRQDRKAALTRK